MKKCKVIFKKGWLPDSKFNRKALEAGVKVEKEHTSNPCWAKQIAKAHLVENKNYYKLLRKMKL